MAFGANHINLHAVVYELAKYTLALEVTLFLLNGRDYYLFAKGEF